jgi:hypothetical protein
VEPSLALFSPNRSSSILFQVLLFSEQGKGAIRVPLLGGGGGGVSNDGERDMGGGGAAGEYQMPGV